ncbi:MAG: SusC/RagA family TonB-linked outer membrane protein [Proteiniphilum sp.]|jgi:TonB-linked SusC/RagA family outer membrane protein|nr:SusC/RagA family TonB-linked outer membrane protein [Proteiniphilum sp.]
MKETVLNHLKGWIFLLALLCAFQNVSYAQDSNRTRFEGRVTDDKGEPLIGVSIILKGATVGGVSSEDGSFSIALPEGQNNPVYIFSYVGMEKKEVTYTGKYIQVVLSEDAALPEIVVTGIFNKPKESYTGAATTITAKELEMAGNRNILSSIRNIDPSFNIADNITIGSNPNSLPTITMRGSSNLPVNFNDLQADASSLRMANQPLIIMNGFEISLERLLDMDDNQVESITLLKDASATAMYGTRASNGVLVVKTKTPKSGKLQFTYKGNLNVEAPDLNSYNLMNALEKLEYEKAAGLYKNPNAIQTQELEDLYNQRKLDAERGVNTYWLKYPVRTGVGSRHSLNIEGGEETFKYGLGVSYNNIAGTMKGSERDAFNGNMLFLYKVSNLSFQNDLQIAYTDAHNSPYGSFSSYGKVNSYWTPYDSDGNIAKVLEDYNYLSIARTNKIYNPLYNALLPSKNTNNYTQIINNFSAEWTILPELFFRGRLSVSSTKTRSDEYISAKNTMFENYTNEDVERKGRYIYGTGNSFGYEGQVTLNYSKLFDYVHQVFVGGGWTINETKAESYSVTGEGITLLNMDFLGMTSKYLKDGRPSGSESIRRSSNFILNGNYTYNRRYFVDINGAYEGSSQFGTNKRYAPFWSTGVGWNLNNEKFLQNNKIVNTARLRLSYGVTGSQQFSPYLALLTYQGFGGKNYQNWFGSYIMALGNEDLGWQQTNQYNLGTEWELFDNRIRLNVDVYRKMTDNLLATIDIPTAGGFEGYTANIGKVENKGIELSFNAFILQDRKQKLNWSVGGTLIHNTNIIKEISNSLETLNDELLGQSSINPSFLYKEGESLSTIFAVRSKGIDPSNGKEIFIKADGSETYIWDAKDKVACGVSEPKISGSLNTTLRYKGIYLSAYFTYRTGGQIYNSTLASKVENVYPYDNLDRRALYERWKQPGDIALYKGVNDLSTTNSTTRFVMDENSFRFQTISLGYDFPVEWTKKHLSIPYLSVRGYMEDLLYLSTIKRERGLDYPFSRKFSVSLTFRF